MGDDATKLDIVSPDYKRDPFATYARLHDSVPTVKIDMPLIGPVWMVVPHDGVVTMLKDNARFVQEPQNAGRRNRLGISWWTPHFLKRLTENMLGRDQPAHRRLRGLVDKAFSRRGVEDLRPRIEAIADRLLDEMEDAGQLDLMTSFARPLPLAVITELLGLPDEDRPKFTRWVKAMTRSPTAMGQIMAIPSLIQINRYIRSQVVLRRKDPRDDLITALVEAEEAGDQLSEDELVTMIFLLLVAGHETTVHLIGSGTLALLRYDDQRRQLQADMSGIGLAVEELLRFTTPVEISTVRYASEDMDFHGLTIARGDPITAFLGAANADPAVFPEPDKLDLSRDPNPHMSFGSGVHFCLGLQLARLEGQIAFKKLFERFPDLAPAVPIEEIEWLPTLGMRGLKTLPVTTSMSTIR